jgi:Raf kinase inhibitor-like YbhB/YbcL family protein
MRASPPCRLSLAVAAGVLAAAATAVHAAPLAWDQPGLQAATALQVGVPNVTDGGVLPTNYTADGRNVSPAVTWSAGPPSTASYAIIMEDADDADAPVRWLAYNIPKGLNALPRGVHNRPDPTHPLGMLQGRNDHASFGYAGPRLDPHAPLHHFHLEVFALDRTLRLGGGADLRQLEAAMSGHVVARGELVTTYPPPPPPPKSSGPKAAPALDAGAPSPPPA